MDPITQGTLGAVLSQSVSNKKTLGIIGLIGFLSGLAPDLDIFIRSEKDPLLFLEFHRQFTHSLIFIPFGGFICAVCLFFLISKRLNISFKDTWISATLGYATHGLLDACTSYGTLLFWPFTQTRIAWNSISIIDPLFTIPLFILIILAGFKQKKIFSEKNLNKILYLHGREAVMDVIYFKIFKSKKIDSRIEEIIKEFKDKKIPSMPLKADVLIKKYDIPEGKELGKKLKIIEEFWINNEFKISKKEIEKIINN